MTFEWLMGLVQLGKIFFGVVYWWLGPPSHLSDRLEARRGHVSTAGVTVKHGVVELMFGPSVI